MLSAGSTLYGMTYCGGASASGTIFSIQPDNSGFTLLHSFTGGADGGRIPYGSLISAGSTLYGMTNRGGASDEGTIFSIRTDKSGFTLLHTFTGGANDGCSPRGSLLSDGSTLYGMTYGGGTSNSGTIFSIQPDKSGFKLLHSFTGGANDGRFPRGSLLSDGSTLYGMTYQGGASNCGTIFSIQTDKSGYTLLHTFAGEADDGCRPYGSLLSAGSTLYGMTSHGGASDSGVVFSLGPATPLVTPTTSVTPTPSVTPTTTPYVTPTSVITPTPTVIKCFHVAGRVVDKDTGVVLDGATVRLVCSGERSGVEAVGSAGEYDLEICTHFEDGTVRAEARRGGYLPGYADAAYIDWADEGVVDMGDIELKTASVSSGGIISGDYDGDGYADIAIFRPATGLWAIRGISRLYFGGAGDELVPADYNGDGSADVSIFRASSGLWAIRGMSRMYYGTFSDIPVPGDYSGDGTSAIGVFRGSSGLWSIRSITRAYFGGRYDQPAAGDYDGDGLWDTAIFRSSSGLWAMRGVSRFYFGTAGDQLVPGDYNGLGYRSAGIFRATSGLWAIKGITRAYFGGSSDLPVPADYAGSGMDSIGIYRGTSGLWAVRGITRAYYGSTGDIPVTR